MLKILNYIKYKMFYSEIVLQNDLLTGVSSKKEMCCNRTDVHSVEILSKCTSNSQTKKKKL